MTVFYYWNSFTYCGFPIGMIMYLARWLISKPYLNFALHFKLALSVDILLVIDWLIFLGKILSVLT